MAGPTPLESTPPMRANEQIAAKAPEGKPAEVKIGPVEQGLIGKIDNPGHNADARAVLGDIAQNVAEPSKNPSQQASAREAGGAKSGAAREVIDMVEGPDGKWVVRPQASVEPNNPRSQQDNRVVNAEEQNNLSPRQRWIAAEQGNQQQEANKQRELQNLRAEGTRLAAIVYTPEGQQQIADTRSTLEQIVNSTTKEPRSETVHPGFDNSPAEVEQIRQANAQRIQAWIMMVPFVNTVF